ncbi:hypothetical protein [Peribacillus sp. CSMR9]|uniref:hypothetical protein n=1 Tax=Peribacillus sp. CSMR9 TaxID=2981350 RepID=UPI002955413A|nr:hypothetical protein [Peribacillus sp. CSMR9]MDV7764178.1 hypothetical protein [Peribacillus sp. CSMR9]
MTYEIGNNLKIYLAGHPGFHFPFLGLPLILSHFFAVVANLFGGYCADRFGSQRQAFVSKLALTHMRGNILQQLQ